MRRRHFIAGASAAALLARTARAQDLPVIGWLDGISRAQNEPSVDAFFAGLRDAGFRTGDNVEIEYRFADGRYDRLPALAADLVQRSVAVIFAANGADSAHAAVTATSTIPTMVYPVAQGLISSYAHPGGNNPSGGISQIDSRAYEDAASKHNVAFRTASARTENEIPEAIRALAEGGASVIIIEINNLFFLERTRIGQIAPANKVPALSLSLVTDPGYILTYGTDNAANSRRAAIFVDRILKGATPGDLPIEFPQKFILPINLKTARALGIEVPQELLNIADQVIE